jgi:outer membrane protein W
MKKVLLSALAVFAFTFANAQEEEKSSGSQTSKGKWLVEANTGNAMLGTTGFYFSSQDGESQYNIGLDGGYFIMDNLALKAGLGYGGASATDSNIFSYRLGAKYYAMGMIPVTLDLTGASIKDAVENPMWLGIGAGYAWFLGENVSIEPGIRYNHSLNDDFTDKGIFQVNIGFALHF